MRWRLRCAITFARSPCLVHVVVLTSGLLLVKLFVHVVDGDGAGLFGIQGRLPGSIACRVTGWRVKRNEAL